MDKIDLGTYKNVGEYIAFDILQWPDLQDPADSMENNPTPQNKEERYRTIEPRLRLRLNHYPIPVQESIQYFVLWSTRDMSLASERGRLENYLAQQFIGNQEQLTAPLSQDVYSPALNKKKQWMWFVNPIELRSVAAVHHIHVFVRDVDHSQPNQVVIERQ
jgi:hypothetical protein